MKEGIIQAHPRHITRRIRTAMQGNIIRALVELITNSDDSYFRLEGQGAQSNGEIEALYDKQGHCGLFCVRDYAEGMSFKDVCESFESYGAATSKMETVRGVRGCFGQGAKDALAGMIDGKFCTFKDNQFVECRLFIKGNETRYQIEEPIPATPELRQAHGIKANGTVAYFKADPEKTGRVARFDTVQEELTNGYLLRKIMTNPARTVRLISPEKDRPRRLRYRPPKGKELLRPEEFSISCPPFGNFPIRIWINRADAELTQAGDDRHGGILIVDDEDVVYDISLFKYDAEPLAARFYGEAVIEGFKLLLKSDEPVLSEERDGLIRRHPFSQALIPEIEKRIERLVREEKLRGQKEDESKLDAEEAARYRKAFTILNEIAEQETEPLTYLGPQPTDLLTEPPGGFCLYPSSAQITVEKRYAFELRLNTKAVPRGSLITVATTTPKIRSLTSQIRIDPENGSGILRKYITVQGAEPNIEGKLRATAGKHLAEARIFVTAAKELLGAEGMAFEPESVTLRPNRPRKVYLLVYVKIVPGGSTISISSDNDSVQISQSQILVNEADATRHVAKYELEIWGEADGEDALITAAHDPFIALLEASVRSKKDNDRKGRKGMFSEPEFNYDVEPARRTGYSAETGKVIVYVNFPSIRHYLGQDCQYKKSLPAQVLVADLVAERCFYQIAERKAKDRGAMLNPQAVSDRIERDARELSKKCGQKVHEALVDQKLLREARSPGGG